MFSLFSKSPSISEPVLDLPDDIAPEESSGIFDPVPANSTVGICGKASRSGSAHDLESRVQRRLLSEPGLNFRTLTVRRMGNGAVCIEGVLTGSSIAPNIDDLAQEVDGVQRVVNHVLVCQGEEG